MGGNRDASFATEHTDVEETTVLIQDRLEALVERLVGYRPRVTDRWVGCLGHLARSSASARLSWLFDVDRAALAGSG